MGERNSVFSSSKLLRRFVYLCVCEKVEIGAKLKYNDGGLSFLLWIAD